MATTHHEQEHEDGGRQEIDLSGLAGTPAALTTHEAASDPHTGYRKESDDHSHASTGAQGGTVAHSALTGVGATDHHSNANDPSSGQKAALAGTSGTPGAGNLYVTDADSRNTNSRAPSGSAGGDLGGTYPNPSVASSHSGSTHAATQAAAEATAAAALSGHTGDTSDAHDASAISVVPTGGLTATDVQAALAELDGDIAGGGHTEDHDHDGSPTQKLAQANTHQSPDTDTGTGSLHHTIGTGSNQAAAGNHGHVLALPTWVGAGAITSGTGDITPPLPTHQANDILWCLVESANQAVATPAGGWEKAGPVIGFGAAGAAGALRGTLFWLRAASGATSNPTITDPGDHAVGVCFATRGHPTSGQPFLNVGCARKTVASTAGTARAGATPVDACLVLNIFLDSLDSASARYSSPTNADLANVTEQIDGGATDGVGGGFAVITGEKAIAGSFAATTITETSTVDASTTLVLLPAAITSRAGFIDRQEFLTTVAGTNGSDTWLQPTAAKRVCGTAIGAGASGSGGRNAATAAGGGGGGGGMYHEYEWAAGELPSTMTVTIGAGGPATANTDGAASTGGGASQLTAGGVVILSGNGGVAAGASATGSGGLGGNGAGRFSATAAGVASFTDQQAGGGTGGTTAGLGGHALGWGGGAGAGGGTNQGTSAGGSAMRGAGGGGGGRSNTNVGTGGASVGFGGVAGGSTAGAAGGNSPYYEYGGGGGAGGTSASGPGGAGGWPGGGGGGGGSQSGAQRGGAGGDGVVVVTTFC